MDSAETIERVPIHTDADGVVRVAGTRVTLDTIVAAFDAGAAAEEIAEQYSSVPLPDVYSVITYYLRHKAEVSAYLQRREEQAATVREEVERRFPPSGVRERLLARRRQPRGVRCCVTSQTRTSTATSSGDCFAGNPTWTSSEFKTSLSWARGCPASST